MKHQGILRQIMILALPALLLAAIGVHSFSNAASLQKDTSSRKKDDATLFSQAVQEALDSIQNVDIPRFARHISKEGLVVVNRWVNWESSKQKGGPFPASDQSVNPTGLPLQNLEGLRWEEARIRIGRDNFNGEAFNEIIKRMSAFVKESRSIPNFIRSSPTLNDHWNERVLGAAVEGKIVSNTFWYLSFIKEDEEWKLLRMEVATH